jgi:hypothetical protein
MKSMGGLTRLLLGAGLIGATGVQAQNAPTPQFDILGFIQEATLDTAGTICQATDPRLRGGTLTVNGHKLIVPCNTLLQLPAATMTWADLFDPENSRPVGSYIGSPGVTTPVPANPVYPDDKSGLALADAPAPFPSFEVRAQGNVVNGRYVVGLIAPVTQQGLNAGSGIINYIDYKIGALRVGGTLNDTNCASYGIQSSKCSGALVQVNDPVGRWGLVHSPDPRFSGDYENSTISAATGIPVCIPRVAPPLVDSECPLSNRPLNGSSFGTDPFLASNAPLRGFTMPAPVLDAYGNNTVVPDAYKQVPMMVGDQIDYAGTLYKVDPSGPNTPANLYISAHTLSDNLGIFTAPGVPPAYVTVEEILIGTGGAGVQGLLQEASTRLTVVGATTDPTRLIDIYAQDVNACTGEGKLRWLAATDPSTQPVKGRFVYRVLGGTFMPPTRNYVIKSQTGGDLGIKAANGVTAGQFLLPNFEFIFPENHAFGDPLVPFNFQDLGFLAQGSGPVEGYGSGSAILSQLDPWPGNPAPTKVNCSAAGALPVVNAGADLTATALTTVKLTGNVSWDSNDVAWPRTLLWTQDPSDTNKVTLLNPTTLTPSFYVAAAGTYHFTLTATDQFGASTDSITVNVIPAGDILSIPAGGASWQLTTSSKRGSFGKLNVTATSNDSTAMLSLTEIALDGSSTNWGTGAKIAGGAYNWSVKGAAQPRSLTITSTSGGSLTVTCNVQSGNGTLLCQ